MKSTLAVVLPVKWPDVLLHVLTERSLLVHYLSFPLSVFSICCFLIVSWFLLLQGTGRYSVYVANYAQGRVGPHALLEMDEAASDVSRGVISLSDVAAEAGVNKLTGEMSSCRNGTCPSLT